MLTKAPKSGFSLTELAVVLAIIGLVVGGIYVAASTVYEKRRASELYKQVMMTAQNVRNAYSAKKNFSETLWYSVAKTMKIYPPSLVDSGTEYLNAYGGTFRIFRGSDMPSFAASDSDQEFLIVMKGLTTSSCMTLLLNYPTPQVIKAAGITKIGSGNFGPASNISQGITMNKAQEICATFPNNSVIIGFSIRP